MQDLLQNLKEEVCLKQQGQLSLIIDGVFYLILNKKGNAIKPDFIRQIHEKLDEVQNYQGQTALVTVSSQKSLFSGGLDLKFMKNNHQADNTSMLLEFMRLIGRLSVFPCPTIAMIHGHCIAGGFILAMAHDYRISSENANFCMNEVLMGMPLPSGMFSPFKLKLSYQVNREIVLFAKSYNSQQALQDNIIDQVVSQDKLLETCTAKARLLKSFGENKKNFADLKQEMNKNIMEACFNHGLSNGILFKWQAKL